MVCFLVVAGLTLFSGVEAARKMGSDDVAVRTLTGVSVVSLIIVLGLTISLCAGRFGNASDVDAAEDPS
jgi:hypothetical protein